MKPEQPGSPQGRTAILTVVLGYAVFGALWIMVSDRAVAWLLQDPALIVIASTLKGWAFVALTSLLLYQLMRSRFGLVRETPRPVASIARRSMGLPLALAALVIAALTAATIAYDIDRHKEAQAARLQTIADLKTRQITDWLKERQADADFLMSNRDLIRERAADAARPGDVRQYVGLASVFEHDGINSGCPGQVSRERHCKLAGNRVSVEKVEGRFER